MVLGLHLNLVRKQCMSTSFDYLSGICAIAVPLFFTVSGYLLSTKEPSYKYSFRKIFNILKYCFIVCLGFDIMLGIVHRYFVFSFPGCFIQEGMFAVFWYFLTMMLIYLLLPVLLPLFKNRQRHLWSMLVLGLLSFFFFVLDYLYDFEFNVIVSFRLWHFLFFFFIGAYIRKWPDDFKKLRSRFYHVAILAFAYYYVLKIMKINLGFHFGSPLCWLYVTTLFLYIQGLNINNSKTVTFLSNLFLPVYSFHFIIYFYFFPLVVFPLFESRITNSFLLFVIEAGIAIMANLILAVCLSKIPLYKKISKI